VKKELKILRRRLLQKVLLAKTNPHNLKRDQTFKKIENIIAHYGTKEIIAALEHPLHDTLLLIAI
jgi:hypothetical protein